MRMEVAALFCCSSLLQLDLPWPSSTFTSCVCALSLFIYISGAHQCWQKPLLQPYMDCSCILSIYFKFVLALFLSFLSCMMHVLYMMDGSVCKCHHHYFTWLIWGCICALIVSLCPPLISPLNPYIQSLSRSSFIPLRSPVFLMCDRRSERPWQPWQDSTVVVISNTLVTLS